MKRGNGSRREFLKAACAMGAPTVSTPIALGRAPRGMLSGFLREPQEAGAVDYTLHIKASPV
ncbi:MAG: hypothetical protein DMG81_18080, partial [Acidobacteria bacterium]